MARFVPIVLREQSEQFGINTVDDTSEVGGVVLKVHTIGFDDQYASLILVEDKIFVFVIKVAEVVDLHGLFVFSSALLDLRDKARHRLAKINHHVGHFHLRLHEFEEFHEGSKIAVGEVTSFVIVAYEDINALENTAVLNDSVCRLLNGEHILEALLEEIGLQTESPTLDIAVIIFEIRIEADTFESWFPAVVARQHFSQRCFSGTDISSDSDIHKFKSAAKLQLFFDICK